MEEELRQTMVRDDKKTKIKVLNNFTTDYRGKLLNICEKGGRGREILGYNVRVKTEIDTCRPMGRLNVSMRGGNRELLQEIDANVSRKWI